MMCYFFWEKLLLRGRKVSSKKLNRYVILYRFSFSQHQTKFTSQKSKNKNDGSHFESFHFYFKSFRSHSGPHDSTK